MPTNPIQVGEERALASEAETVNPTTYDPPAASSWPPEMSDLGLEGKWGMVTGKATTDQNLVDLYDYVKVAAGGTDNWWGQRIGFDWNNHESVGGGTYFRDSGNGSNTNVYNYMMSLGKKVHACLGFTSRSHQRKITIKGRIYNGTAYTDNTTPGLPDAACAYIDITEFNGVAGAGPQSSTTNGGLHIVGPGLPEIAGSPPDASRIVDQVGNKVYPNKAISGQSSATIQTWTLGGYSDPDPKLETDEPEAYGAYVDWFLSASGYPNVSTIVPFNEGNHRMGTMPFLDLDMQARRIMHGYYACKNRNPNVYFGLGSTAGTRGTSGTYLGAELWFPAMFAKFRSATIKAEWQALRDTLPQATKDKTSDTYPFDFMVWHPYDQNRTGTGTPKPYMDPADPTKNATNYMQEIRNVYVQEIAVDPSLTGLRVICDELNCWFDAGAVTGAGGGVPPEGANARNNASYEESYIHLFRSLQTTLHPHYWHTTPGWPDGKSMILGAFYFVVKDPGAGNNHGLHNISNVKRQTAGEARSATSDGVAPLNSGVYGVNETHTISTNSTATITAATDFPFAFMTGKRITATGIPTNTFLGTKVDSKTFKLSSSRIAQVDVSATASASVTATVRKMGTGNDQWDALKYAE
jgi:hypothetical protein